jgi:hypothetical protein
MTKISGSFKGKATWLTTIPQPDVAGHEVSVVEITGVQKSEDPHWNNANVTYWGVADAIAGNGAQVGCYSNRHADGDYDRGAFEARVITAAGKTSLEGTWTMTSGTGRFNGATGHGTFRSRALSASEVECAWDGEYQTVEARRGAGR